MSPQMKTQHQNHLQRDLKLDPKLDHQNHLQRDPQRNPQSHGHSGVQGQARHLFRGRFETRLDPKGRLSLPSTYRSETSSLIVTNSRFRSRSCLHVYTSDEWEKLESKIGGLSALQAEIQAFSRFYLSGGQMVELDAQGRFSIPLSLRRYAGLEADIMLVGLGDKFEIWAQDQWSAVYSELTETFEETLNAVAAAVAAGKAEPANLGPTLSPKSDQKPDQKPGPKSDQKQGRKSASKVAKKITGDR